MFEILNFFPKYISEILNENIKGNFKDLEEIRIRVDNPIILKFSNDEVVISYKTTRRRSYKNSTNNM